MPNLDWRTVKAYCPGPDCVRFEDAYDGMDLKPPAGYEFTGRMVECKSGMLRTPILTNSGRVMPSTELGGGEIRAELRKLPEAPKPFVETRTVTFSDVYGRDYIEPPTGYEYTGRMIDAQDDTTIPVLSRGSHNSTYGAGFASEHIGYIRAELRKLPEPPKPVKHQFEQMHGGRHFVMVPTGEYRAPLMGEWFIADSWEPACCKTHNWAGNHIILKSVTTTRIS